MTITPPGTDYLATVTAALAAQSDLRADQIDVGHRLATLPGIESVKILRAVVRIEDECAISIPDDFLFETATVQELVDLVALLVEKSR